MESYFQYRRINQAIQEHLALIKDKCSCTDYMVGCSHEPGCQLCTTIPYTLEQPRAQNARRSDSDFIIVVGWDGKNDPLNATSYSTPRKLFVTALVSLIAVCVTAASAIDSCGLLQYSDEFRVSETVGSLATGLFLVGFGFGSLFSGPFSEVFGRNPVYLLTMLIFLIFIMAAALAPNLHSHLIFRFIAGFFGSTPLSCAGGTMADLWDPVQKSYAFPAYAISGFAGPVLGQIIGSYIPTTLGWRWLEWIVLILGGVVFVPIVILQPETHGDTLLAWKASALRRATKDQRYRAPMELQHESLSTRLFNAVTRPFLWSTTELIIMLMSLYLTVVYIVLFTFLEGYTYVFGRTYHLSQGMTGIVWSGLLSGILSVVFIVPIVYRWTAKEYKVASRIRPETRLWYAMLGGAPAVPISLFWMAWTTYPSISIWSPLLASVLFGYGIMTIFIVVYLYIIDSYGKYSASALGFVVFTRYVVAGGVTVAGGSIYRSLGVQHTLSILGSISAVLAIIPYLLYFYGPKIRRMSKYAVSAE